MYQIPQKILHFVKAHLANCNQQTAHSLSVFPGIREESLDSNFIAYFAKNPGPFKFDNNWTVRFEAHFIGGERHYHTWEVADIGLMVIFRKNGNIIQSKLAFLQSKKLYANPLTPRRRDIYNRMGMGKLLETVEEHNELIKYRTLYFDEQSKYKAFKKDSEQQQAMSAFSKRFQLEMYYLFYNPLELPYTVTSPVDIVPDIVDNEIGCRVVPKQYLDKALTVQSKNHSPSYGEIKYMLDGNFLEDEHTCGWRLEFFIVDLVMQCKEGLIDDSPNFETLQELLRRKSSPIAAALSITIDLQD